MGRGVLLSLAILLGIAWPDAAPARAGDGRHPLLAAVFGRHAEVRAETADGVSIGAPGLQRYPGSAGGNYPAYGYGLGAPAFNWGYFGAHSRPMSDCHQGYYDRYVQWSFRPGN